MIFKKKIVKPCNKFDELSLLEWIIIVFIILLVFFSFAYNDTFFIIRHGINVMGSIFEGGGLQNFYAYNHSLSIEQLDRGLLACDAMYDFPIYIILGLWNLPLWLLSIVLEKDMVQTFTGFMYGKSLFLLFQFLNATVLFKICNVLNIEKRKSKWAVAFFVTSIVSFTSTYIIGQCDSIGLCFVLLGIYYLMKNNTFGFVAFFSIAISIKLFAIVPFVSLLLLSYKKIGNIFLCGMGGISLTGLSRAFFSFNGLMGQATKDSFEKDAMSAILFNKLPLFDGNISVVFFGIIVLFIWCYLTNTKQQQKLYYIIWITLISYTIIFSSFVATPYWFIYLAPFLSIIILNSKMIKKNILFETIAMISLLFAHYIKFYWCFDINLLNGMLFQQITGLNINMQTISIRKILQMLPNLPILTPFLYALFFICLLAIIYTNRPNVVEFDKNGESIKQMFWIRTTFVFLVIMIPLFLFLISNFGSITT